LTPVQKPTSETLVRVIGRGLNSLPLKSVREKNYAATIKYCRQLSVPSGLLGGDITGQYVTASGVVRGFILSAGAFRTIYVNGGPNIGVHGAQDNGRVMIGDVVLTSDQSTRGYRKFSNDVLFLNPPGTILPCSHARAINERGDIAGAFGIVNSAAECHAPNHGFVFKDGVYDVIEPPGSHDTFVLE
jgi:hypothetical protein